MRFSSIWNNKASLSTAGITDERLRTAVERFNLFKTKLKHINTALCNHHANLLRVEASRSGLVDALNDAIGTNTPISGLFGPSLSNNDDQPSHLGVEASRDGLEEVLNDVASIDTPISYLLSMKSFNNISLPPDDPSLSYTEEQTNLGKCSVSNLQRHGHEIMTYINKWEQTVSTRIYAEVKHVQMLYRNWEKYSTKVDNLRLSAAKKKQKTSNNKNVPDESRINRNETKLRTAKKEYRRNLVDAILLVDEVTQSGWKDYVPLIMKMIQFDIDTSTTMACLKDHLVAIQNEMKSIGMRYEMTEEDIINGRLRILREEDATDFVSAENMHDLESIQPTLVSITSTDEQASVVVHDDDHDDVHDDFGNEQYDIVVSAGNNNNQVEDLKQKDSDNNTSQVEDLKQKDSDNNASQVEEEVKLPLPNDLIVTATKLSAAEDNKSRSEGKDPSPYYLPNSIYLKHGNNSQYNDDLTTLTPYTRCERRMSF